MCMFAGSVRSWNDLPRTPFFLFHSSHHKEKLMSGLNWCSYRFCICWTVCPMAFFPLCLFVCFNLIMQTPFLLKTGMCTNGVSLCLSIPWGRLWPSQVTGFLIHVILVLSFWRLECVQMVFHYVYPFPEVDCGHLRSQVSWYMWY